MMIRSILLTTVLCLGAAVAVRADAPIVVQVKTGLAGMGWKFDVTISHPDSGWEHYADAWEILDANGKRLGIRKLAHPHVDEQPFTRTLSNVIIPDGTEEVFIRTRCSVDGWSRTLTRVALRR